MSRVWGRHAPTRSLRKCRRIAEVKSRWSTTFSRIENLWPRDGSCPLPLRSKPFLGNCFRIVKAQKISRGCAAHVCGSPFAPNAVPAPVCAAALSGSLTESVRSWHGITFRRLMKFSRYSFPKKKNTAHAAQRWILSGRIGGKMNRVCCGAVNLSGMIHGEAVFKMNTTTSCRWFQTNPQNQWDLQEKYHGM